MSEELSNEYRWYVVHTYSGYENKVASNLRTTVENRDLHHLFDDIKVPTETVEEITDGKTKEVERKLFPGYVFIKMVYTDESWYVVKNIRGCTGFVGPGSKPVPRSPEEMWPLGIGGAEAPQSQKPKVVVDFEKGDMVVVIAGAWEGTEGAVQAVNAQKQTVTISVELFGRDTPVEISFAEVRKVR